VTGETRRSTCRRVHVEASTLALTSAPSPPRGWAGLPLWEVEILRTYPETEKVEKPLLISRAALIEVPRPSTIMPHQTLRSMSPRHGAALFFIALAWIHGNHTFGVVLLATIAILYCSSWRTIEFDPLGLTLVPLLPLLPRQSFPWAVIGDPKTKLPRGGRVTILSLPLASGCRARSFSIFPSSKITLAAYYGSKFGGRPLSLQKLSDIIESYRHGTSTRPPLI
jgi:hypothetical protein